MKFFNNTLFNCDALTLVERLPSESVTLAYLDPPWKTGSDFQAGPQESGSFSDSDYASHLSKVIQHVKRLLNDRGSLVVHWSASSPIDLRLVTNQVFGGQPRNEITWPRKRIRSMAARGLKLEHDILLIYCKSENAMSRPLFRPLITQEAASYSKKDQRGAYRLSDLTQSVERPLLQQEWRGFRPPAGRSWRYSIETLNALAREEKIEFTQSGGRPWQKQYLADHGGIQIGTTWDDIPDVIPSSERTGYASQTPLPLMQRIVELASNEGDRVLDPFCGSGTTLIAAQSQVRAWWGADNSNHAQEITNRLLLTACNQEPEKSYQVIAKETVEQYPVIELDYKKVLVSVAEISDLQRDVEKLVKSIFLLKKTMNLEDDADQANVEDAIQSMEISIAEWVSKHSASLESHVAGVRKWLSGWDTLDEASRLFLPQAELLFEVFEETKCEDFSPFILQYCLALENELLQKLFSSYTVDFYCRHTSPESLLDEELSEKDKKKTGLFSSALKKSESKYTLGTMSFIMGLIKEDSGTLKRSRLLQDFRAFTLRYFETCIVEEKYLEQIKIITTDFRNQAAHPYILGIEVALLCRQQVRDCINELILNYKGVLVR